MAARKGSALIMTALFVALFGLLASLLVKLAYNNLATAQNNYRQAQAFYLAEAGLAKGSLYPPNWFTDLPHSPSADANWLINSAVGESLSLGGGRFKLVRIQGEQIIYAVGFSGRAVVVLKVDFGKEPYKWEII